ncbi:WS/DGAT domain-containing protein [Spirillospora sp. NPDC127200]
MPSPAKAVPTSVVDRVLLELSEQSAKRSHLHIGVVMLVEGAPLGLERLRALVAERVHRAPVLGYRLSSDHRRWEPDPDFRHETHIEERRLAPEADVVAEALAVVDEPLRPGRPLWRLVLLHGHHPASGDEAATRTDGPAAGEPEFALCYAAHHAFQDGMAVAATVEALFGSRTLPVPSRLETRAEIRPWRWPAPTDMAVPVRRTTRWDPTDRPLTGQRRVLSFGLDHAALRDIAQETGATRNHACLAALTMALREWHPGPWGRSVGRTGRGLRIAVPLDLRARGGGGALGNQVGVLSVDLPCHEPFPERQLRQIVAQTGSERLHRHREMYRVLVPRLPRSLTRTMYLRSADSRYVALVVTTVRVRDLAVDGMPVHAVHGFPPLPPGQAMMIALLQYRRQVKASVVFDPAVGKPDLLVGRWREAVRRLHQRAGRPVETDISPY